MIDRSSIVTDRALVVVEEIPSIESIDAFSKDKELGILVGLYVGSIVGRGMGD